MSAVQQRSAAAFDALNLCCGRDQHADTWNVDVNPDCDPDEVHDLDETPWPWPDNAFERVYITHGLEHLQSVEAALRESERVLVDGGRLKVKWPVGMNERADPDHAGHQWVWDTPEFYCGKRPWDVDVGLEVIERDVTVHTHLQGRLDDVYTRAIEWYERQHGQGRWLFDLPCTSGEFTVVFEA